METKKTDVNPNSSSSSMAQTGKGRLTDYWEKYPEGLLTIVDRRAILK